MWNVHTGRAFGAKWGGQVRREAGQMETLLPAGGRSSGMCCAMFSY